MNNSAIGKSWEEVRAELFSPQELKEMENKVKLMHRLTVFRKKSIVTKKAKYHNSSSLKLKNNITVETF